MSTPFGRRGFTWSAGDPEWTRIKVPANECPRISPEVLAKEKAALGDRQYRQEYMCEFISDNHPLFDERSRPLRQTSSATPSIVIAPGYPRAGHSNEAASHDRHTAC